MDGMETIPKNLFFTPKLIKRVSVFQVGMRDKLPIMIRLSLE